MAVQGVRVFANAWARALGGTCYVPMSSAAAEEYLRGLAGGVADALLAEPFRASAGYDVGTALVTTHFSSPEALGCTLDVFYARFLDDLGLADRPDARARLAKLLGSLASGYARALRGRTLDQQESIRRAALVRRDQAEQALRSSEARYRHLALHDSLTGLGNRRMVSDRLSAVFGGAAERVGVCLFSLDGFKLVNDSLGHDLGDKLLVAVAGRLRRWTTPRDGDGDEETSCLAARVGGDEFVILVENSTGVDQMIEIARGALAEVTAPVDVDGRELLPSVSVGIVERAVADTDPTDLMRAADITMRRAKRDGPGCWAVYDDERNARDLTRSQLAAALPAALDHDEFVIDYQPLVGMGDGRVIGYEALLRWHHPSFGLLSPDWFIPLAEQIGVIVPLGRHVLEVACQEARRWSDNGTPPPFVSVNLAARQIRQPGLLDDVTAILDSVGLPPHRLQLEITESAVMGTDDVAVAGLRKLAQRGVRIAIDDFGTGYSNLAYLRTLPVTDLKLDGSFAQGLRSVDKPDPTDERIVAALVKLGHSLGLTVTAEGVETAVQADRLRLIGCDAGQGWHFGRPDVITEHRRPGRVTDASSPGDR